jgi:hypothetical protein
MALAVDSEGAMSDDGTDLWRDLERLWRDYARAHLGVIGARREQDLKVAELLRQEATTLLQRLQRLLVEEERRDRVPIAALVTWLRGKTASLREHIGAERPLDWTVIRYPEKTREGRALTR